mgnify:CR=1 FL=1
MRPRKTVVALVGLPSSGKTILGNFLELSGFRFLPEVAEALRQRGATVGEKAGFDFDRKVMQMEFRRDHYFLCSSHTVLIVETWHLGNIAYATARSSPIVRTYKSRFSSTAEKVRIRCIVLNINPSTSYLRSLKSKKSAENSLKFLEAVQRHTRSVLEEFRLPSIVIDASKGAEEIAFDASKAIRAWVSTE